MCIGIPMKVVESGTGTAICQSRDKQTTRQINMLLVGDMPEGTWVLVFLDSAREVLDKKTADSISDATDALHQIMNSNPSTSHTQLNNIDLLFADLVGREPPKPDSLLAYENEKNKRNNSNG